MLQVLATLLAYAYVGFLVIGCFIYAAVCLVLELAGFRRDDPAFEGDKLGYRS
jgi:hypothetical protein